MHKWAKQIMECVKAKVESIGIENFEGQNLDDLKDWTEIVKNIVCFDKDYSIVEAMKEAEKEDNMRMIEKYEDYPDRRYYDKYRYSNGRFAPKGKGTRRGYDESPYYHMTPDMYHDWEEDFLKNRDMDKYSIGRMYYTEPEMNGKQSGHESNYDRAKRNYTETKQAHKGNSQEDKENKMKSLEKYMKELSGDLTEMISEMSPEELTMTKTKLSALVSKM